MNTKQSVAAAKFAKDWEGKGYEKGQSQVFWLSLLHDVLGVEDAAGFIQFEEQVRLDHTSFIDAYIPATKVLIEQKSLGKNLNAPIKQSDGTLLSPFQQAKRYITELPLSKHPRYVVTCNFSEFYVYDMEQPHGEPQIIELKNLEKEIYRLKFLIDSGDAHLQRELEVSMKAGEIVGRLYDLLHAQYIDPDSPQSLRWLNILCVRLVFCLYAEDAGLFSKRDAFHDFISNYRAADIRRELITLFEVLNTPESERSPYLSDDLKAFPYTNGGLFDEKIEVPQFTEDIRTLLLQNASLDFDWSEISPTIFGAVFESTLNPETRRSGGMHYTSIENIHKVIDPLFLDDLKEEFDTILDDPNEKRRKQRIVAFQDKLASLTFFDPACGSGNFLTETYLSLRRLENKAIKAYYGGQTMLGEFLDPVKVSIQQFYGIEINDFAVTVATTALWISEAQMLAETEKVVRRDIDFLPLKTYSNITEGNALRIDWETVVPKEKLSYIMGNPPFIGYSFQTKSQKEDILSIYVDENGKPYKTAGKIDYVAGWYFKAAQLMQGSSIKTAFVSTNSITQGEQVASVWQPLYKRFGVNIDFAYQTFQWDSESSLKAHVHCVIVGFSCNNNEKETRKFIYRNGQRIAAQQINPYLIDAENIFIESRKEPLCDVPQMNTGNRPADGGFLIIEDKDYDDFVKREPKAQKYIKRFLGSQEFINNKKRWCLWLIEATPAELRSMPLVMERIAGCKNDRLNAPDEGRRKLADRPHLFRETNNPKEYVVVPKVSSENRRYIPMGFLNDDIIPSDLLFIIPDATLYHFGVLTSNVHMAWMRVVCGRLKSDYRYSKDIVYNNFPWPSPTAEQRQNIEASAQAILDARALYPDSSLADLYDELTMPPELRKAHQNNDRAVMAAYGFDPKEIKWESQCVAELFKLYQRLVG